jgi:hypothetical protein
MYEIKKIKIWPFARSLAILSLSAGLAMIIVWVFFIGFLEGDYFIQSMLESFAWLIFLAGYLLAIIVASLAAGALGALLYNLISQKIGGIIIDIAYLKNKNEQDIKNV